MKFIYWVPFMIWSLVACGTSQTQLTPMPTLTLIPATSLPTKTPVLPTSTVPVRIKPLDLVPTEVAVSNEIEVPATLEYLVNLVLDDLDTEGREDDIRLVAVQDAVWRRVDYGCTDEILPVFPNLEIPGYRLVFSVDGDEVVYHTNVTDTVRLCASDAMSDAVDNLLLYIDPVAEELVNLAKRRIVNQERINIDQISVVSVSAYRWKDTSLGCPLPDNTYQQVDVDGYRLVLQGVEKNLEFIFHTSFDQIVRCDLENEQLP